jgi:hypothetical protein
MNVLDACLRRIRRKIPEPILRAAFVPDNLKLLGIASSVDNEIMNRVLREYVIPEVARMGQYMEIDLTSATYEPDPIDQYSRVYFIDEQITGGRELVAAHIAVTPVAGQAYTLPPAGSYLDGVTSGVLSSVNKLVDSNSAMPRISSAEVRIAGPNAIVVKDPGMFVYATKIMAQFAMTEELNEIKPAFFPVIEELAEYACKGYIHSKLIFDMDSGMLQNGMQFGAFSDVIQTYSDAGQMFDDTVPKVRRCMVHNDDIGDRYNYMSGGRFTA